MNYSCFSLHCPYLCPSTLHCKGHFTLPVAFSPFKLIGSGQLCLNGVVGFRISWYWRCRCYLCYSFLGLSTFSRSLFVRHRSFLEVFQAIPLARSFTFKGCLSLRWLKPYAFHTQTFSRNFFIRTAWIYYRFRRSGPCFAYRGKRTR